MGRASVTARTLLPWLVLVSLLTGCQSAPATKIAISRATSLLALDVVFPVPLSRDPDLVQVFLVRGPIHAGLDELPDLIPVTFVKGSRAYLLDPEPGSYSVVAVTAAYAPPWNEYRIAGVSQTTWSRTSSDAMIFPAELIQRTLTTIGPGRVEFMGTLQVSRGDRIDSTTEFQNDLQRRIAQRIRPGATSKSGFAAWLERTRLVNLEKTSFSNEVADRESFFEAAAADLGDSPWAGVIARAATRKAKAAKSKARAPAPKSTLEIPEAVTAKPPSAAPEPEAATENLPSAPTEPEAATEKLASVPAEPEAATGNLVSAPTELVTATENMPPAPTEPEATTAKLASAPAEPDTSPPSPKPRRFPGLPPDSLLSEIEFGMRHDEVRKILGPPDDRIDRLTAKAWIPFYTGPGANLRDWIYAGQGRVVFSLYKGKLEVIDVVYDPDEGK
jgi:hypothetical protein